MSEPIVLEGRLRHAGDGYECSGLYLDDRVLTGVLEATVPHRHYERRYWVVEPPYEYEEREPGVPEPWTPVDREAIRRARLEDDGPYCPTLALFRDYGRVRITIERIGEPTP